jgi:hypothetical protein
MKELMLDVRFGSLADIADILRCSKRLALFDHLVG